jgi:GT2 family glycosyltransferase
VTGAIDIRVTTSANAVDAHHPKAALRSADAPAPLVSLIIPLYESDPTLGDCLRALKRQTFRNVEVILIDSTPHDAAATVARGVLPEATYVAAGHRLLAHAARNVGAAHAGGELLVFTDPDIYPNADWLERLVTAWRERPDAVVLGSIACHGRRWLDRGVHLVKFNVCLPGGDARAVPLGWSGNLLVERRVFESLGGWDAATILGDSLFTARARAAGHTLWFEPRAVVQHDHERVRFTNFVRERFRRGHEFAAVEDAGGFESNQSSPAASRPHPLRVLFLSPFRIVNRIVFIGRAASDSNLSADYWFTLPVVACGVIAWYAGICSYHWHRLTPWQRPATSG